jgi:hypothetical protein
MRWREGFRRGGGSTPSVSPIEKSIHGGRDRARERASGAETRAKHGHGPHALRQSPSGCAGEGSPNSRLSLVALPAESEEKNAGEALVGWTSWVNEKRTTRARFEITELDRSKDGLRDSRSETPEPAG